MQVKKETANNLPWNFQLEDWTLRKEFLRAKSLLTHRFIINLKFLNFVHCSLRKLFLRQLENTIAECYKKAAVEVISQFRLKLYVFKHENEL